MSVLLALTLVTTISYSTFFAAYALEQKPEQTTEQAAEPAESAESAETAAPAEATETAAPAETTEPETAEAAENEEPAAVPPETAEPAEGTVETKELIEPETAEEQQEGQEEAPQQGDKLEDLIIEDDTAAPAAAQDASGAPVMPTVSASSYIVLSGSTSEKVIEQHAERKMSPGKMTLLMTAMVVIDNMYNEAELNNTVTITEDLMEYGDTYNVGESVSVGDLLNAMLIGGDGQSAEALASYSATKRKIFINEMNSKALSLGLMDTQFSNPRGGYNAKTYSTAADCAVIAQAAIRYQLIKDAFEKKSVTVTAESKAGKRVIDFTSVNPLLADPEPANQYEFTKGGLMGTIDMGTPEKPQITAQYAGVATVDDMQLIVVLMDSQPETIAYEAKGLLEYGNTIVTRNLIVKAGKRVGYARVRGGALTRVPAYTETKGFAYVPPEGSEELIQTEVVMFDNIEAPLKEGTKVGEYRIYVADELKGTVDLVTRNEVPEGWYLSYIYISNRATIAIGAVIVLILLILLRKLYLRRRRRKRFEAQRAAKLRELALMQMQVDEDRKRRDWDLTGRYDEQLGPRTSDLREEARRTLAAEASKDTKSYGKKKKKK